MGKHPGESVSKRAPQVLTGKSQPRFFLLLVNCEMNVPWTVCTASICTDAHGEEALWTTMISDVERGDFYPSLSPLTAAGP